MLDDYQQAEHTFLEAAFRTLYRERPAFFWDHVKLRLARKGVSRPGNRAGGDEAAPPDDHLTVPEPSASMVGRDEVAPAGVRESAVDPNATVLGTVRDMVAVEDTLSAALGEPIKIGSLEALLTLREERHPDIFNAVYEKVRARVDADRRQTELPRDEGRRVPDQERAGS